MKKAYSWIRNRKKGRGAKKALVFALVLALTAASLTGCSVQTEEIKKQFGRFFNLNESLETGSVSGKSEKNTEEAENGSIFNKGIDIPIGQEFSNSDFTDYLPEKSQLFINNAPAFYYYGQISDEERVLYDALFAIVQDPTTTKYHKQVTVTEDPEGEGFRNELIRAYEAMIFDHPELFWFRQNGGNFQYSCRKKLISDGTYDVVLKLSTVYENYEAEMTAFNQAVQDFMAGIDLSQSQPAIGLQIHDRLIDMLTYDNELADSFDTDFTYDYGYSAYGAMVANSRGQQHTCVCDGYTYAYMYLLQQAGIVAIRVGGRAGDNAETARPHSWNLVQYDGEWYEVDPTWDDRDPDSVRNPQGGSVIAQATADPVFWDRIRHFQYNLTTDEIRNYAPNDSFVYYTETGYATFLSSSVHIRDTEDNRSDSQDYISYLAPVATGTTYTYDYILGS
uniref:transglutaminase domain-containing protein n=1 Tax=Eubacterium cellulosolvens TaxID=29322 RepID=UPI00048332AF|nr:hypothetical protein [[Eubacterium] cellulosolvens]